MAQVLNIFQESLVTCVAAECRPEPAELDASIDMPPPATSQSPVVNSTSQDPPPAYTPKTIKHLFFKDLNNRTHTLHDVSVDTTID